VSTEKNEKVGNWTVVARTWARAGPAANAAATKHPATSHRMAGSFVVFSVQFSAGKADGKLGS
jgi:hypothetical protein